VDLPVRTEITIETHEVMVIRRRGSYLRSRCSDCGEQAAMLTLEEATTVFPISMRNLFQFVEAENLHYVETSKGTLLVCSESLAAQLADRDANGLNRALEESSSPCESK
jgi:hypothetical protein